MDAFVFLKLLKRGPQRNRICSRSELSGGSVTPNKDPPILRKRAAVVRPGRDNIDFHSAAAAVDHARDASRALAVIKVAVAKRTRLPEAPAVHGPRACRRNTVGLPRRNACDLLVVEVTVSDECEA
eukprot:scaffold837_cov255-Pinguiococcus_pyrenoidosus.AAC.8